MTKVRAKAGCQGCHYEQDDVCPATESFEQGIKPEKWPCTDNGEAMIWVDEDDTTREGTTPQ